MVQGVSKQVIVVQAAEKDAFEQAIFILKDDAVKDGGVTQAMLLRQAQQIVSKKERGSYFQLAHYLFSAAAGGLLMGVIWLLVGLF